MSTLTALGESLNALILHWVFMDFFVATGFDSFSLLLLAPPSVLSRFLADSHDWLYTKYGCSSGPVAPSKFRSASPLEQREH